MCFLTYQYTLVSNSKEGRNPKNHLPTFFKMKIFKYIRLFRTLSGTLTFKNAPESTTISIDFFQPQKPHKICLPIFCYLSLRFIHCGANIYTVLPHKMNLKNFPCLQRGKSSQVIQPASHSVRLWFSGIKKRCLLALAKLSGIKLRLWQLT